jgi:hypothetical protein
MPAILHSNRCQSFSGNLRHDDVRPGRNRESLGCGARRPLYRDGACVDLRALGFGALCVLSIGLFDPPFWLRSVVIRGAGIGGGCQAGINSLSGLVYPPAIRSTGAGSAPESP